MQQPACCRARAGHVFPVEAAAAAGRRCGRRRRRHRGRILAQELTKGGGLSVLIDNKPGAGGTVATREALRAPADGHTLMMANVGVMAVIPYATKDAGYDPRTDIAPVCLAVDFSNLVVVHPGVPARTLAEYLALARRPDGMDYGTSGVGSAGHLAGELLKGGAARG